MDRGLASPRCHRFVKPADTCSDSSKAHRSLGYNRACAVTHSGIHCDVVRGANPTFSTGSTTSLMASIYPFRAWRYNPSAVKLDEVVTQPYDKISPAMQQAYYQRSPHNLVRIILGLPELFDARSEEHTSELQSLRHLV